MITVKAYLYPNTAEVQVFDPTIFTTRNRVVYSRPIKVYQGIDNPVQVMVKNQDQKSVNLAGHSLQADIQDPTNHETVASYAVTWADAAKGLGNFVLDNETVSSLQNRFYKLTFKTVNTTTLAEHPIYIDDNYGVPLDLEVLPAYYSTTVASADKNEYGYIDSLPINTPAPDNVEKIIYDGGTI
jgi:hypothetical protein